MNGKMEDHPECGCSLSQWVHTIRVEGVSSCSSCSAWTSPADYWWIPVVSWASAVVHC